MGTMTIDEAVAALDRARIASARLNTMADVLAHPQLVARDRWREVQTPAGPIRALRSAVEPVGEVPLAPVRCRFQAFPTRNRRAAANRP